MSSPKLRHGITLVAFAVLTVVLTYPLVLHMGDAIPGPNGDNWQYFWNLWWMRQVVTGVASGPFHTDFLYFPTGINLYFDTLTLFDAFVTLPFQLVFNAFVAYNVAVFAGFAFSGWGAYLLTHYLLGGHVAKEEGRQDIGTAGLWLASFVAGFIFTFSPYHFAHLLGHLNLIAMEWLPLYVLFLLKALDTMRWKYVPIAGLFLALTALADWYYVMYLLIFTVILFAYRAFTARRRRLIFAVDAVRVVGVLGVFTVVASPLLVPMLREAMTSSYAVYDPVQTLHHSPDLLAFFAPSPFNPLWGAIASKWTDIYNSPLAEKIVFAGYLPLALAGLGLWRFWRQTRFWLVVAAIFFVLALGPILHVAGRTTFTAFQANIPLPYLLLYYLPFVKTSRAVARFDVIVMLCVGVMAAWGLLSLMRSAKRRRWPVFQKYHVAIPALALLVIGFEFLAIPFPISKAQVPSVYEQIAQEPGQFGVLDIPFSLIRSRYLLYQTVDGKKIVGGYTSRVQPFPFVQSAPGVQQLVTLSMAPDINQIDLPSMGENVLDYYNIRYVVVHKDLDKPDAVQRAMKMAETLFGHPPDFEDGQAAAFRVEKKGDTLFVQVGNGWYDKESTDQGQTRWMADHATLVAVSSTSESVQLHFQAWSLQRKRTLDVYAGDRLVANFVVQPGSIGEFSTGHFEIPKGETELRLVCEEPPESPANLGLGNDQRLLSISVSNVSISR
ncbi:MAG: hypothetical protein M1319_01235 [Chloroflexi bacterium]|nr:hypothetical protein [Chloroflexota bacterium]